jgi:hypothetical protein
MLFISYGALPLNLTYLLKGSYIKTYTDSNIVVAICLPDIDEQSYT